MIRKKIRVILKLIYNINKLNKMTSSGELDKHQLLECQQVLENMVTTLLMDKPDDPVPHII